MVNTLHGMGYSTVKNVTITPRGPWPQPFEDYHHLYHYDFFFITRQGELSTGLGVGDGHKDTFFESVRKEMRARPRAM